MKNIIIRVSDNVLKVDLTNDNTTIFDSYRIKSPSDMKLTINEIKNFIKNDDEEYAINKRSIIGMIHEWRTYNLLYSLGIFRNRTKDVDLNIEHKWYIKVMYFICSLFYLHYK